MKTRNSSKRLSHLALALALSCGTVGGLLTVAALTEPALARGQGGGGQGGGEGSGGGEPGGVMNAGEPRTHARSPNNPSTVPPTRRAASPELCDAQRGGDVAQCKFSQRSAPRVIRITGFAGCSAIQQIPGTEGRSTEFYCIR